VENLPSKGYFAPKLLSGIGFTRVFKLLGFPRFSSSLGFLQGFGPLNWGFLGAYLLLGKRNFFPLKGGVLN